MIWNKAQEVAKNALLDGSLLPISTEPRLLTQNGVDYFLHLKNHNSKIKFEPKPKGFNPFLPYEPSMYVCDTGAEHVCLLNKFPVLSPHLLICSNEFIEQTTPLTEADFNAWIYGLNDEDALGFYNGGKIAGASQPHRHMQLVKTQIPLQQSIIENQLAFSHKYYQYTTLDPQQLNHDYLAGMKELKLFHPTSCKPYNLLLGLNWMLIIPRISNNIEGVFANGINYSGHFLLGSESQITWLEEYGVMNFLADCTR